MLSLTKCFCSVYIEQHRKHHIGEGMKNSLQKSEFFPGMKLYWAQLNLITNSTAQRFINPYIHTAFKFMVRDLFYKIAFNICGSFNKWEPYRTYRYAWIELWIRGLENMLKHNIFIWAMKYIILFFDPSSGEWIPLVHSRQALYYWARLPTQSVLFSGNCLWMCRPCHT